MVCQALGRFEKLDHDSGRSIHLVEGRCPTQSLENWREQSTVPNTMSLVGLPICHKSVSQRLEPGAIITFNHVSLMLHLPLSLLIAKQSPLMPTLTVTFPTTATMPMFITHKVIKMRMLLVLPPALCYVPLTSLTSVTITLTEAHRKDLLVPDPPVGLKYIFWPSLRSTSTFLLKHSRYVHHPPPTSITHHPSPITIHHDLHFGLGQCECRRTAIWPHYLFCDTANIVRHPGLLLGQRREVDGRGSRPAPIDEDSSEMVAHGADRDSTTSLFGSLERGSLLRLGTAHFLEPFISFHHALAIADTWRRVHIWPHVFHRQPPRPQTRFCLRYSNPATVLLCSRRHHLFCTTTDAYQRDVEQRWRLYLPEPAGDGTLEETAAAPFPVALKTEINLSSAFKHSNEASLASHLMRPRRSAVNEPTTRISPLPFPSMETKPPICFKATKTIPYFPPIRRRRKESSWGKKNEARNAVSHSLHMHGAAAMLVEMKNTIGLAFYMTHELWTGIPSIVGDRSTELDGMEFTRSAQELWGRSRAYIRTGKMMDIWKASAGRASDSLKVPRVAHCKSPTHVHTEHPIFMGDWLLHKRFATVCNSTHDCRGPDFGISHPDCFSTLDLGGQEHCTLQAVFEDQEDFCSTAIDTSNIRQSFRLIFTRSISRRHCADDDHHSSMRLPYNVAQPRLSPEVSRDLEARDSNSLFHDLLFDMIIVLCPLLYSTACGRKEKVTGISLSSEQFERDVQFLCHEALLQSLTKKKAQKLGTMPPKKGKGKKSTSAKPAAQAKPAAEAKPARKPITIKIRRTIGDGPKSSEGSTNAVAAAVVTRHKTSHPPNPLRHRTNPKKSKNQQDLEHEDPISFQTSNIFDFYEDLLRLERLDAIDELDELAPEPNESVATEEAVAVEENQSPSAGGEEEQLMSDGEIMLRFLLGKVVPGSVGSNRKTVQQTYMWYFKSRSWNPRFHSTALVCEIANLGIGSSAELLAYIASCRPSGARCMEQRSLTVSCDDRGDPSSTLDCCSMREDPCPTVGLLLEARFVKDETLKPPAEKNNCAMAFPIVLLPKSAELESMPDTSRDELQARIYDTCEALTTTIKAVNNAMKKIDGEAYQFSPALRNWRAMRWEKLFRRSGGPSRRAGEPHWMRSIRRDCTVREISQRGFWADHTRSGEQAEFTAAVCALFAECVSKLPNFHPSTKASSLPGGGESEASQADPGLSALERRSVAVKRPPGHLEAAGRSSKWFDAHNHFLRRGHRSGSWLLTMRLASVWRRGEIGAGGHAKSQKMGGASSPKCTSVAGLCEGGRCVGKSGLYTSTWLFLGDTPALPVQITIVERSHVFTGRLDALPPYMALAGNQISVRASEDLPPTETGPLWNRSLRKTTPGFSLCHGTYIESSPSFWPSPLRKSGESIALRDRSDVAVFPETGTITQFDPRHLHEHSGLPNGLDGPAPERLTQIQPASIISWRGGIQDACTCFLPDTLPSASSISRHHITVFPIARPVHPLEQGFAHERAVMHLSTAHVPTTLSFLADQRFSAAPTSVFSTRIPHRDQQSTRVKTGSRFETSKLIVDHAALAIPKTEGRWRKATAWQNMPQTSEVRQWNYCDLDGQNWMSFFSIYGKEYQAPLIIGGLHWRGADEIAETLFNSQRSGQRNDIDYVPKTSKSRHFALFPICNYVKELSESGQRRAGKGLERSAGNIALPEALVNVCFNPGISEAEHFPQMPERFLSSLIHLFSSFRVSWQSTVDKVVTARGPTCTGVHEFHLDDFFSAMDDVLPTKTPYYVRCSTVFPSILEGAGTGVAEKVDGQRASYENKIVRFPWPLQYHTVAIIAMQQSIDASSAELFEGIQWIRTNRFEGSQEFRGRKDVQHEVNRWHDLRSRQEPQRKCLASTHKLELCFDSFAFFFFPSTSQHTNHNTFTRPLHPHTRLLQRLRRHMLSRGASSNGNSSLPSGRYLSSLCRYAPSAHQYQTHANNVIGWHMEATKALLAATAPSGRMTPLLHRRSIHTGLTATLATAFNITQHNFSSNFPHFHFNSWLTSTETDFDSTLKHVWCPPAAALLTASTGSEAPGRPHETTLFFHPWDAEKEIKLTPPTQMGLRLTFMPMPARGVADQQSWNPVSTTPLTDECDRGTSMHRLLSSYFVCVLILLLRLTIGIDIKTRPFNADVFEHDAED
ncbi:uncharacterized protein MYCFIDRAFT_175140 [Pseudocercospora fijiensis CIRAD86]|uniref:Uncharacterized protein n=1 Tax=Pseudocercospora fijiensis (strain CIRAD86) TaxID=383855 RepID=M3AGN5_PSEFD|nr:uncharacterized protein MYCFIDRAFT_175140 [Pseudocercospora fijiensis CIRAD86]EME83721.1 hypothetical protein MYCFIDRAFT_175140 [Pseudocercospora fijiensis CIRAD86]